MGCGLVCVFGLYIMVVRVCVCVCLIICSFVWKREVYL